MRNEIEYPKADVDCSRNGEPTIIPFREAHESLWQSNYGWVIPQDWYRWAIGGHSAEQYPYTKVKRAALRLGFFVHTRNGPMTIDDLEHLDKNGRELTIDAFTARACRFNRLFSDLPVDLRPFHYLEVLNDMGIPRPAYRMYKDRTWTVILGPGPGIPSDSIDWSILQTKPKRSQ